VMHHLRTDPSALDDVAKIDVFDRAWLDSLSSGEQDAPSSAIALLVNLIAASTDAVAL
jgi:hypothetical protein